MSQSIILSIILSCFYCVAPLLAQESSKAETVAIEAVVTGLFDAMRANDSTQAAPLFHESETLRSIGSSEEGVVLHETPIAAFVQAVGMPRETVWDERIANLRILQDGPMAMAWMDYSFYVDSQLHHCGVNAFTLIKTTLGWQILEITDTRREQDCPERP